MVDVLELPHSRAIGDPSRQLKPETRKAVQQSSDRATPNMLRASHLSASVVLSLEAQSFNCSRDLAAHAPVV